MDTSKNRRLQVFKSITRDLTPELLVKAFHTSSHSKAISTSSAIQFSFFPTDEDFKAPLISTPLHSSGSTNPSFLSTPRQNLPNSGRCAISAYKPNEMHTIMSSKGSLKYSFHPSKPETLENTSEISGNVSFESSSDYFSVFSNSPMLSTSTQESSREECEERRKPKKRPLGPNEKDLYVIKIQAIKLNQDTRTTVMIKNIPNKYTQKMLLQAIDKKFMGTYDFLYLPIDFKNRCNVGYAFINFLDFKVIPAFCQEFNMKKWEKFNSEKICELAYGRIQGLRGLIQHFQNSSVINQVDSKVKPVILGKH
ncbi:hypothetical protein SteCoe_18451 [Stentor coeruleus]|uniref:Mei2-like C-terminal RNA recognition motif domain-containing protein n=1 Tax=Stentor coeruleus TaxID=5963 RepID=A0A1R2BWV5_9CILI|nr:hypothetical protein SteCoe_18451 [Stentor coeruleus]